MRAPAPLIVAVVISAALGNPGAPKEGDRAPHFSVKSDQGRQLTPIEFGGKVLILNFWHTFGRPCVKELPSLRALAEAFKANGVVVLAVSGDSDAKQYERSAALKLVLIPLTVRVRNGLKRLSHFSEPRVSVRVRERIGRTAPLANARGSVRV